MCTNCGKPNHFAVGCKFRKYNHSIRSANSNNNGSQNNNLRYKKSKENVHAIEDRSDSEPYIDELSICSVSGKVNIENNKSWFVEASVNNKKVLLKLDTGASCNCMPLSVVQNLGISMEKINNDDVHIVIYGNNKIKTHGSIILNCIIKGNNVKIKFLLVEGANVSILGLNACVKLNLVQKVDTVDSYFDKNLLISNNKEVFEGTGKIPFSI